MEPKTFAGLRHLLGITQQELADRIGVHRGTVARWETGKRKVPEMAARLLDIEYAHLLERTPK